MTADHSFAGQPQVIEEIRRILFEYAPAPTIRISIFEILH
jgi:hypothetical protein